MSQSRSQSVGYQFPGICLAVCGLVTLGGYWSGIEPVIENAQASMALESQLDLETRSLNQTIDQIRTHEQKLQTIKQKIRDNRVKLKPASDLNHELDLITKLADEMKIVFSMIKPLGSKSNAHYQTIPVQLKGKGDYRSCTKFFEKLHATHHDLGIASFEFRGDPNKPDGSAAFEVRLHWFAQP